MTAFRELAEESSVCIAKEDTVLSNAEDDAFDEVTAGENKHEGLKVRLDWRENSLESWLLSRDFLYGVLTLLASFLSQRPGAWFTNDLRETLTYGELLKPELYLILGTFAWESYSNNFIRCLYNRARCILIDNFLELDKIRVSKV